jgi:hypothetical protein
MNSRLIKTELYLAAALLAASASLAVGSLMAGFLMGGLVLPLLGGVWWVLRENRPGMASIGLFLFTLAAGLAILFGAPPLLMLSCVVAALAAWDLDRLSHRLRDAPPSPESRILEILHLRRLGVACVGAVLIGGIGLILDLQTTVWVGAGLTLLVVIVLSRFWQEMRK